MFSSSARNSGRLSSIEPPRVKNMGKSSRVSSVSEVMKPQIWENFPEDLFESVLARLPLATIFCFRTVCRQWNNLLTSQSFFQHFAQVSQTNPWFYTTFGNNNYIAVYDPVMKRWYCPPAIQTPEMPVLPIFSAGGLVCFYDTLYRDMCVCNPLTRSFKILPIGSIKNRHFMGMTMNDNAGYRVLQLGNDREYEIYDSVTKYWSHLGIIPADIMIPHFSNFSKPVAIGTTLYIRHIFPEGILSCDTSTGVWTQHLLSMPFNTASNITLAESDGRIMFVGLLRMKYATCVCIWELSKTSFLLKEIDRMPCLEFHKKWVNLTCFGNKGWLMLHLQSHNVYRMFTYNIATREWQKVFVPFGRNLHNDHHVYGTAFQPCLTAMP